MSEDSFLPKSVVALLPQVLLGLLDALQHQVRHCRKLIHLKNKQKINLSKTVKVLFDQKFFFKRIVWKIQFKNMSSFSRLLLFNQSDQLINTSYSNIDYNRNDLFQTSYKTGWFTWLADCPNKFKLVINKAVKSLKAILKSSNKCVIDTKRRKTNQNQIPFQQTCSSSSVPVLTTSDNSSSTSVSELTMPKRIQTRPSPVKNLHFM